MLRLWQELLGPGERESNGDVKHSTRPLTLSDSELLDRARMARNGRPFSRLFDQGDWQSDYPSQSEADLALCCHLAFYSGNDPGRMDGLFRQSGLMRDKWLRDDYAERTIARACEMTAEA